MHLLPKITAYFCLLAIVATAIGCMTYKEVEIIAVTKVEAKKLNYEGAELELSLQIKNPNNYDIHIVNSDLTLFAKGNNLGNATIANNIMLPQKSNQVHQVMLHSSTKAISMEALPVLIEMLSSKPIEIQVLGHLKAKAKGISKTIPINFKEKIDL